MASHIFYRKRQGYNISHVCCIKQDFSVIINLEHVTFDLQFEICQLLITAMKKINPSCSMPPALIKEAYDYFSISLQTDCLISLSEAIQHRATCAPPFSPVTLLAYALNTI